MDNVRAKEGEVALIVYVPVQVFINMLQKAVVLQNATQAKAVSMKYIACIILLDYDLCCKVVLCSSMRGRSRLSLLHSHTN